MFRLNVTFSDEYNAVPPLINFMTIPFHPNSKYNIVILFIIMINLISPINNSVMVCLSLHTINVMVYICIMHVIDMWMVH